MSFLVGRFEGPGISCVFFLHLGFNSTSAETEKIGVQQPAHPGMDQCIHQFISYRRAPASRWGIIITMQLKGGP